MTAGVPKPKAGWGKVGRSGVGVAVGVASGLAERWAEGHQAHHGSALDDAIAAARARGAQGAAPPSPFVGVWDVALTPVGSTQPLAGKRASFHGDGRLTLGPGSGPPDLAVTYRIHAGTLLARAEPGAEEEALPAAWGAGGDSFTLAVPQGTLAFRRRPVSAAFAGAAASAPAGGPSVEVRARLRVDHAPGLPVEARCRLLDGAGRPVPARAGSALAGPGGGLVASVTSRPATDPAEFAEVRLAFPLADLPDGLAGQEVHFALEAWCPRDRREVTAAPAGVTFSVPAGPARRPAAAPKP